MWYMPRKMRNNANSVDGKIEIALACQSLSRNKILFACRKLKRALFFFVFRKDSQQEKATQTTCQKCKLNCYLVQLAAVTHGADSQ